MDLLRFVLEMRTALHSCGQVSVALQGNVEREDKAPDSVHQTSTSVSVVDRVCQEILLLRALELAPDLAVQSEEMEDLPEAVSDLVTPSPGRWALIVDPVDGTGDYLSGKPTYAHMLGLLDVETGRMGCGAIYFPVDRRLYFAVQGMGAFRADGYWGPPVAVGRPESGIPRTVEDVKRLLPSDHAALAEMGYAVVPPSSASAAVELTRVALGDLGAMAMRHFHGHDTAISSVIIEELGGAVLDHAGRTITYELAMPRTELVVSSLSPVYARELVRGLTS